MALALVTRQPFSEVITWGPRDVATATQLMHEWNEKG
jgi:hypothetical protein